MSKKEKLSLKCGTLKGWHLNPEGPAMAAIKRYHAAGPVCMSVMMQRDNAEQKKALCEAIDALDADLVWLDWDEEWVDKEAAKKYVMEFKAT